MRKKPKRKDLLVGYMPATKTPIKMKAFNNERDVLDEATLKQRLKELRRMKLGYKPVHVTKDYHIVKTDKCNIHSNLSILGNS